jgi:hypothetical protein
MILGLCCPNGEGDFEKAKLFGANFYRLGIQQALSWKYVDKPYILLLNGAEDDFDTSQGEYLASVWDQINVKPMAVLCQNEQNEISYLLPKNVQFKIDDVVQVPILKGPNTCCVERAGRKAYEEMRYWDYPDIEVLNYYEPASYERFSFFNRMKRRYRFKKLIKKLRNLGVTTIIVSEFHAGSKWHPKTKEVHGDYLYHTKKDFDSIVKFLHECDIEVGLYYSAPFLGREYNEII